MNDQNPSSLPRSAENIADSEPAHEATRRLLHELQVHQIELESQNEELAQTRAQMESALRHYRDLFELAPVGYIHFDASGRIGEINAAGANLLRADRESLRGRSLIDYLEPSLSQAFIELLGRTFSKRVMQSAELTLRAWGEGGKSVHLRVDVQADPQGETARAVLVDISAQRELESRLTAARQEAERASQTKSAFVANMSHEIRTPLSAIIGRGHLLRADIHDPGQRRKLDQLCDTSEHLLAIINDILDFSKIEAGELIVDCSEFGIEELVERVVRLFGAQAKAAGLHLASRISPPLQLLALQGDALRLSQVLINLVSNAVKFTASGSVLLDVELLSARGSEYRLRFSVTDTGCGIGPLDQAALFEPFTQVDASTTRRHGGTGLGLAISQRLVGLMGGRIQLQSQVGAGSRFWFELDLSLASGPAEIGPVSVSIDMTGVPDLSGKRILVAEDHILSREILVEMLTALGCEVDAVRDGAGALERARDGTHDLVLMDLQMPGMDGLAAARAIRGLPGGGEIPIIALTANVFAEDRQRCLEAGMNAHLAKPVTPATLASVLSRWIPAAGGQGAGPVRPDIAQAGQTLHPLAGLVIDPSWRASSESLRRYVFYLERFLSTKGAEFARSLDLVERGDLAAAADLAHALKGAASMVGAEALAERTGAFEDALKSGQGRSELGEMARRCELEFRRLDEAFRQMRGAGGALSLDPAMV